MSSDETKDPEIWKTIKGTAGKYQVSNHGRVRSVTRMSREQGGAFESEGQILVGNISGHGYRAVRIWSEEKGRYVTTSIHVLVAMYFIGPKPIKGRGSHVNHKDLNKTNNYYKNLEWTTPSGNIRHAVNNGAWERKKQMKTKIKLLIAKGVPIEEVSAQCDTPEKQIRDMCGIKESPSRPKKYTEEQIEEALNAVREGRMTQKQAADHFSIGLTTFRKHCKLADVRPDRDKRYEHLRKPTN